MSTRPSRVWQWLERRQIDRIAATVGLLVGLALIPLRFVLTTVYAQTFPVALTVASGLYLLALYTGDENRRPTLPGSLIRLSAAATFLMFAGMVLLAAFQGRRSAQFLDLAIFAATVIMGQILLARDEDLNAPLVLFEVLVLAFVVRGAALYTTPGYIGIDIWTHVTILAAGIRDTHTIAAMAGKYSMAPFYHVYVALAGMIGNVPLRTATYLTVPVVVTFGILFVYAIGREFVPARWALLAVALYAIADDVIEWGIHPIPTSLGLLFFLAGLFLLVRYLNGFTDLRTALLILLVLFAVNFTHQVSAFILLVTIGIGFLSQVLLGNGLLYPNVSTRNVMGFFAFDAGLLSLIWSLTPYRNGSFTGAMVTQIRKTIETNAGLFKLSGGAATAAGNRGNSAVDPFVMMIAQYVDVIGIVVLFAAAVAGSIYVLHHRRAEQATVTLVGAIVAMMFYSLGLPILGINTFVPGRWIAFLYAPMVVIGVIGLGYFLRELPVPVASGLVVIFLLLYPTGMLLSTTATLDNPVFNDIKPKVAFDNRELASMHTLGRTAGNGPRIYSDSPYANVLGRSTPAEVGIAQVQPNGNVPQNVVVYRQYQTTGAPIFFQNGTTKIIETTHQEMCGGRSQVYDNGQVTVCVR